ncbi:MAG: glycosyltransferase, partial [Erysipelotrichaceae bacterium]
VFTEHSSLMNNPNLSQKLIDQSKSIIESVDKVIVVGKSLADNLKKHFDVDSILIPNVVDTSIFTYQNVEAHDDFRFVSIGSLIIRKNMGLLINSFQQAFSNQLNIKLSIYGEGSLTQSLIEQINQLGLQDQITLHGLKSRTVLAGALQNSDCFVLASKSETFGVVYIEALAVGVPVIATRCGGPEDFVTKDNGILIDVDDDRQLIKALQTMVKTSHTYDRHEISTQTKNQFSPEAIANQLSQLYTEVIEGKR